ncbi:TPR repeat protein oca3 [Apiospora marii]|uniref:TPR repeat protein oca3 n=1 Tax=Apiospora marii TaxID=335849 RepID=UPI00312CD52C
MSTPSSDAITFVLSEQESTVIFEQNIIPAEFGGLEENVATLLPPSPPNILIVGQTGAGKTRAAPAIKKAFESVAIRGKHRRSRDSSVLAEDIKEEQEGPVLAHFVADTYKTYHPAYATLSAAEQRDHQPGRASAATGPDARRWLAMAARYAVALRADVLLESACRYPDDFASLAQTFHEGGYRVEVVLLAVPAGLSRLGTLTRFYRRRRPSEEAAGAESSPPRQQGALLQARLTPKKVHDASYEGLLYAAEFVDEASVVDQVVVVRRDNLVVYANEKEKGERGRNDNTGEQPGPGTADALRRERRRPLLEGERDAAADDLARLRSIERGPSSELWTQLADVEALLEPLLAETASVSGEEFPKVRPLVLPSQTMSLLEQDGGYVDLRLGT